MPAAAMATPMTADDGGQDVETSEADLVGEEEDGDREKEAVHSGEERVDRRREAVERGDGRADDRGHDHGRDAALRALFSFLKAT